MQSMLWKQPVIGVVGPEFVLRESKPHVSDRWCAQPHVDKLGTDSFHGAETDIVQVRREGRNDQVKWNMMDIILNEFAMVFYVAVGCLVAIVRSDICKCRRKRLRTVGKVRHQIRVRSCRASKLVACCILYVLMSQHCLAPVQGRQLRYGENNWHFEDPEWFSAFERLPPPGNGPPCVLELSSLLPAETDGEVGVSNCDTNDADNEYSVEVPDRLVETLMALLHGQLRTMATSDIDVQRLHQATRDAWETWSASNISSNVIQAVHVYTDGSAGMYYGDHAYARKAAWAFGIWLESDGGRSLLATDCGHVCTDSEDGQWTGATWGSAAEGERAALLSSAVYVLRMSPAWPVHFWFDSTTAWFGASGRWNHNVLHQDAVLVRCVFQLLEARCSAGVHYGHVKAHQGDPYNELVNTLAYDALMTLKCNPVLDFVVSDMLQGDKPLCAHWVTVFLASSGEPQYPGFEYGRIVWTRDQGRPHSNIVWNDFRTCSEVGGSSEVQPLTMISFNVRTLNAQRDELELHTAVGAYAFLEAQLVDRKVDIAFLQETRSRSSQVLSSSHYKRFAVAASNGNGGTEIWVAQQPMSRGGLRLLHGKNHVVLHQDPECLMLRLEMNFGPMLLIAAHAPHSSHEISVVRSWWEALTARVRKFAGEGRVALGIDANAHFAHSYADVVGGCGIEARENQSAKYFLEFLEACDCWLPSTFKQYHYGVTTSWRHPGRGSWHRCDYIALSSAFRSCGLQSWVDGNFDVGGTTVDHLAVALRVFLPGAVGPVGPSKNLGAGLDVQAMLRADDDEVGAILGELHPIDWKSNIHDHGAVFVRQLRQSLETRFPKARRGPTWAEEGIHL